MVEIYANDQSGREQLGIAAVGAAPEPHFDDPKSLLEFF
jgi:hypothetical protein